MLSASISPRRSNCAVTVVPMLAPMMMPTVCSSFMMPALTKPTHMTVVAAELWISPVTTAPRRTLEYVAGKTLQDMLQPAAGELLQAVRHGGHTKQERGDGAKHGDYIRNIQNAPPNLTPRSNFRKILLISDHDKL